MKKLLFLLALMTLITFSSFAQTKKDGTPDMRYKSNRESSVTTYSTPSSTNRSSTRPVYSGQTHSTSHGGTYIHERNSKTHKGSTYINPRSNNHYGIHKTR